MNTTELFLFLDGKQQNTKLMLKNRHWSLVGWKKGMMRS